MNLQTNFKSLILFTLIIFSITTIAQEKDLPPPNIVWLVSEDNSMHYLKMFDKNGVPTPNIESLAEEGLIYTRAFSNAAVCSAARSTLISGVYGPRLASHYHRRIEKVPMPADVEMFPAYLKRAGYYTTNNSKEDYNIFKADNVWDESSGKASWKNRSDGQPFFHVFNTGITHEGRLHFDQKTVDTKETNTDLASFSVQPNHPDTKLFKYTNAVYRDRIIQMDAKMGEMIAQLKEEGLYDNTFIFYYGDHGGVLPGSKGYLFETGLHIPMVVHVPKNYKHLVDHQLGSKVNGFVSFIDLAPTVLNIAGVKVPKGMDGKPFLGKGVTAKDVNSRDETFSYADRFDEKYDMVRALRKGKYKYIRNYQPFNFDGLMNIYRYKQLAFKEWRDLYEAGKLNEVQSSFYESKPAELLFDVENDPFETKNLANDPAYKDEVLKLRSRLNQQMKSLPDLSFYPEHYLVENAFDNPVQFGQDNKRAILNYMKIADLSLSSFEDVEKKIVKALGSKDVWERYWGIVVCSSFGTKAAAFTSAIKKISKNDSEPINRARALEYMGLYLEVNTLEEMAQIVNDSKSIGEVMLITNSMVLLKDSKYKSTASYDFEQLPEEIKNYKNVKNRLDYLNEK